jgi:hypothetical protein
LKQCSLGEIEVTEAAVKRDAMLGDIDFEHPLFAPFAESQFSDFTGIRFWKHRKLAGFGTSTDAAAKPHSGHVLARFDDGDPAIVEFKIGRGTVCVLTGAWHPADSQLARSSKFPPLMYRLLELASGEIVRPQSQTVGSELAWPKGADGNASVGTVRTPEGTVLKDQPVDSAFSATQSPGLYTLERGGTAEIVAVNLAPEESRTASMPIEQLEGLGVRLGTVESPEDLRRSKERERQLQIEELEQTQKLWRWGVLTAIVLLLAETWLAGRRAVATADAPDAA